jgi:hypothetical protein
MKTKPVSANVDRNKFSRSCLGLGQGAPMGQIVFADSRSLHLYNESFRVLLDPSVYTFEVDRGWARILRIPVPQPLVSKARNVCRKLLVSVSKVVSCSRLDAPCCGVAREK